MLLFNKDDGILVDNMNRPILHLEDLSTDLTNVFIGVKNIYNTTRSLDAINKYLIHREGVSEDDRATIMEALIDCMGLGYTDNINFTL